MIGPGELEAVLASAEFALANAAIGPADAIAGGTRTRRNLEHIRFHCRQLRTALVELAGSDLADNIDKVDKARCICRELRTAFLELNPAATIP
ncbi:MAG: hypothetical protein JJE42_14195, partial [Burkholderiales bacterium]|nr:hypothetical protein [Burkholderiales bacterium]